MDIYIMQNTGGCNVPSTALIYFILTTSWTYSIYIRTMIWSGIYINTKMRTDLLLGKVILRLYALPESYVYIIQCVPRCSDQFYI